MKYIKYKFFAFLFAGIFVCSSCNPDELTELNIDPNAANADVMDFSYLLAFSQLHISGERYENWRGVLIYSSTMIQHMAALATYWSGDKYLYNAQYSGALAERGYGSFGLNLASILEETKDDPSRVNLYNTARICWVLGMSRMTDMYGDIPYAEAGRGFYDNNFSPKYDAQQDIYMDMLNQLDEATTALSNSESGLGVQDLFYGGDITQWKKFGYSLMLRLAMRVSNVDPGMAQQYVQTAISRGVMTSNDDNCFIEHTSGPDGINRNGIGEVFEADANQRLSETFIEHMRSTNDPRLSRIATLNSEGVYQGLPNGFDLQTIVDRMGREDATTLDLYSTTNPLMVSMSSPMVFQTYAEVEFLLAEAAIKGWHNGNPQTHYENGVRAALSQLTVYDESLAISDAEVNDYLVANPWNAAEGERLLGEQYWIATFLNDYESWANWRRTGFPVLTPVDFPGNITNGTIPRRLRYFEAEYGNNGNNINEAIGRQGPDEFTTRMWWDVN